MASSRSQHGPRRLSTSSTDIKNVASHPFSIHDSSDEEDTGPARRTVHSSRLISKASTQRMLDELSDTDSSASEQDEEENVQVVRESAKEESKEQVIENSHDDIPHLEEFHAQEKEEAPEMDEVEGPEFDTESDVDDVPETNEESLNESVEEPVNSESPGGEHTVRIPISSPLKAIYSEQLVECVIIRSRFNPLQATYKMYSQANDQLILVGEKKMKNRTSNYHIFDMTKGSISNKMTKKSGNYLGKLRATSNRDVNVMVSNSLDRSDLGAILYFKPTSDNMPRKLVAVLPPVDEDRNTLAVPSGNNFSKCPLVQKYREGRTDNLFIGESKNPTFENGCYRLNFGGRVSVPSVKNFQMAINSNPNEVYIQFGKVSTDRFHLDFRSPISPFQAFSIAIAQFNL